MRAPAQAEDYPWVMRRLRELLKPGELRQYLSVHWKHPAAKPPVVVGSR